ncbi:MAG: SIMPL domain-containing protein, partial [Methylocystaceae bacterium]
MGEGNGKSPWAVVALILALGLIVSSWVVIGGLVKIKSGDNAITVTGSAKKQIKSDLVVWSGNYSCTAITQVEAYTQLKNSQNKVRTYLGSKGIGENEMVFSSINTMVN